MNVRASENQRRTEENNKIVQGLWIGKSLSVMEQLSITSFIKNGHEYHLYVYEDVEWIPKGTIVKDANEIILLTSTISPKQYNSIAAFADVFRYKLLLEKGGYWTDTDVICLRPFDFMTGYVFGAERMEDSSRSINNGVMKVPAGCEIMQFCYNTSVQKNPQKLYWGEIGPSLLTEAVAKFELNSYVLPYKTFYPVDWWRWKDVISGKLTTRIRTNVKFRKDVYAVHLCNEMWRKAGLDKNENYHPQCLYEKLKERYL